MNYRHIFHAGNISDIVKHAVLTMCLDHLRLKPAPFCVVDAHAGIGLYDLQDPRAQKTAEAQEGIFRLLATPALPELETYYGVLKSCNEDWQAGKSEMAGSFRFYPGSPLIAARLLRAQDRLIACELHEEDARVLRYQAKPFPNVQIHSRDGFEALRAFLPPPEKRGLVLIDPPYELPDEFARLAEELPAAYARWPQGMFMLWYPIKERPTIWRFHEAITASGIPEWLCAEFVYHEEIRHDQLNGCGILFFNPPWKLDEKLRRFLPALHEALGTSYRGVTVTSSEQEKPD